MALRTQDSQTTRQFGKSLVAAPGATKRIVVNSLVVSVDAATTVTFDDGYINEIQEMWNDATGGTFTASFAGQGPTSAIAYNADAATLKTALETMTTIGDVTVTGAGTVGDPWLIVFLDPGGENIALITTNDANLTGLATTITEDTKGVAPVNEIQEMWNDATGGTFTVSYAGQGPTSGIAYNVNAATLKTALQTLSNITDVSVTGDGTSGTPWVITFVDPGGADIALITTNDYLLTGLTTTIGESVKGVAPVNEIQTLFNDATSGTFKLTFDSQETDGLAHDILAADLKTALQALSNIADVTVTGVGDTGDRWTVTFVDPGGENVAELTADDTLLFGGTGSTTINTTTPGVAAVNEIQSVYNGASTGTFKLTYDSQQSADIDWDVSAAGLETALELLASITDASVTGVGTVGDPWLVTFVNPGSADLSAMTSVDAFQTSTITESTPGVAAVNEIQSVHNDASGGTFKLTYSAQQTGAINYNASAGTVETALQSLGNITDVDVTGDGTAGTPWLVVFVNPGSADLALMTSDDALLTGESSTVTETTTGGATKQVEFYLAVDGNVNLPYSKEPWFVLTADKALTYSTGDTVAIAISVVYEETGI